MPLNEKRCELCNEMNSGGNRGKNVTCRATGRIIPNIETRPYWCPIIREGLRYQ